MSRFIKAETREVVKTETIERVDMRRLEECLRLKKQCHHVRTGESGKFRIAMSNATMRDMRVQCCGVWAADSDAWVTRWFEGCPIDINDTLEFGDIRISVEV